MRLSAILPLLLPLVATAAPLKKSEQIRQNKKSHGGLRSRQANTTTDALIIECNGMLPLDTTRDVRIELCNAVNAALAKNLVLAEGMESVEECNLKFPHTTLGSRVDLCGGVRDGMEVIFDEECNKELRPDTLLGVRIEQCGYVKLRSIDVDEERNGSASVVLQETQELDEELNGGASFMPPE
jgi:hypothetical protein